MRIKTDLPLTLKEIANNVDSSTSINGKINAICTDSRKCEMGDLFIALSGDRYNGADFIDEARRKGAFIMATENADIKVTDTENALLKISSYYKRIINPAHTVAITGSIGKTTVKDFTYSLLSKAFVSHKTEGNYNNALGLSYTLLSMKKKTETLICEFGMNHTGEISKLSKAIAPDIAIITNIGSAHIGNLGSREKIAEAKLEIRDGMTDGRIIVNQNEPLLKSVKNPYFISYTDQSANLYAEILSITPVNSVLKIQTERFKAEIETSLYSRQQLDSLLYAISVCDILGMCAEKIFAYVKEISPSSLRQKFIRENGYTIYDDSYNSSPEAVINDLRMLSERSDNNSVVLGDMLELGEYSEALHFKIGTECARFGFKKLYAFGKYSRIIAKGATDTGMDSEKVFTNEDISKPQITAKQISESYEGETLLVKASHFVNADRIIKILLNKE